MQDLKAGRRPLAFRVAFFLIAYALHAQVTSTISGYVKDSSGAVITNATVTAVSTQQGLTRTAHSGSNGYYELVAIPAATYNIAFEAPGFQRLLQSNVELQVNQNLRLDGLLTVGEVHAEVTVTSSAMLVNTANSTLSDLVDERRVQDLPLNGRNIMNLTEILPGVTDISAPETMANTRGGPLMSVNGSRQRDNNFTFNGANWTNFSQSSGMNYPRRTLLRRSKSRRSNSIASTGRKWVAKSW